MHGELGGLFDRLHDVTLSVGRTDLAQQTLRARDRALDQRIRVLVAGQTGQGASTLAETLGAGLLPADLLLDDTPGTSGAESVRAAGLLTAAAAADVVLFVSDASQEYTEPETTLLAQLCELCPTVVGVVTKIDDQARWSDVQRADRAHLTRAGLDVPLLPVSARLYARAVRTGDDALAVESGVPQLAEFLGGTVVAVVRRVRAAAVVEELRVVADQVAMVLDAELDLLRDPGRAAQVEGRLRAAREAAETLRERTANWQVVLADGGTELQVDVDHDLRDRLRHVVREAEADIMRRDPARGWEAFGEALREKVSGAVRANFVLAHARSRALATEVATRFAEDGRLALPTLRLDETNGLLDPVQTLEELDSGRAGVVQRVVSSLRGSYGGVLMVGLMTSLAGLALVNPWSIGAGVLLGANTFWEDHRARTARRQAEAKAAVARFVDDVAFQVGRESKARLRTVQRTLRDHFAQVAVQLQRSADDGIRAAQEAGRVHDDERAARAEPLEVRLGELRRIRARAAALLDEETR
ncbi:MAG: hypothetical protein ABS81_08750 [Pseudonocardia sp. SCN 72-86]|nr:MAG: hypothetical protein ABS81_08750 [Pseudonocardia sp. SCN 72-86]